MSKNEAQRKGYAVKSAKVEGARKERVPTISKSDGLFPELEYCLEGEAADYFQSRRTFFFGPESGSALLFLTTDNSTPSGTI